MALKVVNIRVLSGVKWKYLSDGYFSFSLRKFPGSCTSHQNTGFVKDYVRYYSRKWRYRKPLRAILPEEISNDEMPKQQTIMHDNRNLESVEEPKYSGNAIAPSDSGIPHYVKLRENTHLFISAVNLAKSRKQREKKRRFFLEGKRLIQDALNAGVQVDSLFFSQEEVLKDLPLSNIPGVKLYKVMYKDLSIWSDLTTSPGIMGIFHQPDYNKLNLSMDIVFPLTVICDNIREPGNLGAILRCVVAAGCQKILLTKGCVDIWEPKVLRAGCGAHFQMFMQNNIQWELVGNYLSNNSVVYIASNDTNSSSEVQAESSKINSTSPKRSGWYEVTEDGQVMDPTYLNKAKLATFKHLPIMQLPYSSIRIDANQKELVLIVGGETDGVSDAAHKFARDRGGQLIFIPMRNNIESLNSAVALGIIIYEMQRQFCN